MSIVLSSEQRAAVDSEASAIVVSAGAGSGKTEVIAHRIERILADTADEDFRVLAVSYTVKAADELRSRLADRLGGLHRRVDADTIHGFALSILRQFGTRIGLPTEPEVLTRDEDRLEVLEQWITAEGKPPIEDPAATFARIDLARSRCKAAPYLDSWRSALAARGALDYPAILERALELLESPWVGRNLRRTYRHAVVDEAQNLTRAQYLVLCKLAGPPDTDHLNLLLVGDARQSIVGFAGADPSLIASFERDYNASRFELRTNYRSAARIVLVGASVSKALGNATRDAGENIQYPAVGLVEVKTSPNEEAEGLLIADWASGLLDHGFDPSVIAPGESTSVTPEQIAVLGRSAASMRSTREALSARGIECAQSSTEDEWVTSTPAKVAIDLIAFMSAPEHRSIRRRLSTAAGVAVDDWSDLSILLTRASDPNVRLLTPTSAASSPEEFISSLASLPIDDEDWLSDIKLLIDCWRAFIDDVGASARTFGNLRQFIFRTQRGNDLSPGVRVLTIHKAQGREFRAVALVGCNEGQIPDFRAASAEDREAELRAFYVAVSRASRQLLLTRPAKRRTRYGDRVAEPSSFLAHVSAGLGSA